MAAETGMMQIQTKEPSEGGRDVEGFSYRAFRGNLALLRP